VIIDNLVGFEAELNGETNGLNTMGSFYYTLGPADVFLKNTSLGTRIQILQRSLHSDVISGKLTEANPTHVVSIPDNTILEVNPFTIQFGFKFSSFLKITGPGGSVYETRSKTGMFFGPSQFVGGYVMADSESLKPFRADPFLQGFTQFETASVRGDSFCGPGIATFSLPPSTINQNRVSHYIYRLRAVDRVER
jgi:hypothetical protein